MSHYAEPPPHRPRLMLVAMCGCVAAVFGLALGIIAIIPDFAMIFLVFQYEVYVLGYGALKAALGIAPPGLIMIVVVPLPLVLARRWGERVVVTLALARMRGRNLDLRSRRGRQPVLSSR